MKKSGAKRIIIEGKNNFISKYNKLDEINDLFATEPELFIETRCWDNAKTLRKYSSSNNYEEEKRIVAILSKDKNSIIYDTAVYCDIQSPISIDLNVLNQMSNNIKRLFETE